MQKSKQKFHLFCTTKLKNIYLINKKLTKIFANKVNLLIYTTEPFFKKINLKGEYIWKA